MQVNMIAPRSHAWPASDTGHNWSRAVSAVSLRVQPFDASIGNRVRSLESVRTGKETEEPMDTISLNVTKRQVLGKKTKALRRAGITPAHVFGHGVKSQPLQGNTTEIERVLSRAGTSRLISLGIEGEKRHRSVLVREVQREPVTDLLVHVDFYQVRSKEKMS
ncbi:MAG: hypothetical protein ACOC7M_01075, partial [Chloroflexota bacterium]